MKSFNLLLALVVGFAAVATAPEASAQSKQTVLVRGYKFRPYLDEVTLTDLTSMTTFEGRYFKIVLGKIDDQAISLTEADEDLRLKAATTYYHLSEARRFWVEKLHSDYVANLPQITVRLELTTPFSELAHFYNDAIEPQFNNALSIPAGQPMDGIKDVKPWGPEIWFRPVKQIPVSELPASGLDGTQAPLSQYLKLLEDPVESAATSRLIQDTMVRIFLPEVPQDRTFAGAAARTVGTIALTRLIISGSRLLDRFLLTKYYYMDAAMIPEVIRHEFAHIALSDSLAMSHSTAVIEGMADYFSTTQEDIPTIGDKIRQYSKSRPKNGRSKASYNPVYEWDYFANSDFVLSVLWSVRDEMPELADQIVHEARHSLHTDSSDIRHDLIRALLDACTVVCPDPRADRMRLREVFELRGF